MKGGIKDESRLWSWVRGGSTVKELGAVSLKIKTAYGSTL